MNPMPHTPPPDGIRLFKREPIASGFAHLDTLLGGGLRKGELTILGARPTQGKTSLALQIASCVALKAKQAVLLFSSEHSRHAVMERLIVYQAQLNPADIHSGFFPRGRGHSLTAASVRFAGAPRYIVDVPKPSTLDVRGHSEQLVKSLQRKRKTLGLVIIDQLQLLKGPSHVSFPTRREEVAEILKNLKELATEFNVAVLLLSQLPFPPGGHSRDRAPRQRDLERAGVTDHFDNAILLYRKRVCRSDPALDTQAWLFVARRPIRTFRQCGIRFDPDTSIFSS